MGTPYSVIYDAFTAKILEDEWYEWDDDEMVEQDMRTLLEGAIPYFKFPRTPLLHDDEGFVNDLDSTQVQILATYMKIQWLNRCILTWQNLKPLYSEADFSQANMIAKANKLLEDERANARRLESIYYRSVNERPWDYTRMAGK